MNEEHFSRDLVSPASLFRNSFTWYTYIQVYDSRWVLLSHVIIKLIIPTLILIELSERSLIII